METVLKTLTKINFIQFIHSFVQYSKALFKYKTMGIGRRKQIN